MTLHDLIAALWDARVVLWLRDNGTPAAKGPVTQAMRDAFAEHRAAVIDLLKGAHGARLEGLECGTCHPDCVPKDKVESERMKLRHCEKRHLNNGMEWATAHYPRRTEA